MKLYLTVEVDVTPGSVTLVNDIEADLGRSIENIGEPGWGYGPTLYTVNSIKVIRAEPDEAAALTEEGTQ